MRKGIVSTLAISVAVALTGCSDPMASDEYKGLEQDLVVAMQERDALQGDLEAAQADLASVESDLAAVHESLDVPDAIWDLMEEWEAANERGDGSVVELYFSNGYHHDGTKRVALDDLESSLALSPGWEAEWITEPFMIVDDGDGRYVVTRGLRLGTETFGYTSAFTFEIETRDDGTMGLVHTAWAYAH